MGAGAFAPAGDGAGHRPGPERREPELNYFHELKTDLVQYLQGREGFDGVRIQAAFPADKREYPLKQPVVAVGLDSVEISPGGLGGYWGEREGEALFGDGAQITVRFDLYAPAPEGGGRLHDLYEALCGALMPVAGPFGLTRLWCGEAAYDKEAAANRLVAKATLRAAVLRGEDEPRIRAFELRRNNGEE